MSLAAEIQRQRNLLTEQLQSISEETGVQNPNILMDILRERIASRKIQSPLRDIDVLHHRLKTLLQSSGETPTGHTRPPMDWSMVPYYGLLRNAKLGLLQSADPDHDPDYDEEDEEDEEMDERDFFRSKLLTNLESINSLHVGRLTMNEHLIRQDKNGLRILVFLTGCSRDSFEINIVNGDLEISGKIPDWVNEVKGSVREDLDEDEEIQDDEAVQDLLDEDKFTLIFPIQNGGEFTPPNGRQFDLEGISASYNNGLLRINVPYVALPEPQKISVNIGE